MHALRGNLIAFGVFAASFALHIVGGATDQGWLFALAVVLIFASAVLFPVIAQMVSGGMMGRERRIGTGVAALAGVVLTSSALWATNDRTLAWWQPVASVVLVGVAVALVSKLTPLHRDGALASAAR